MTGERGIDGTPRDPEALNPRLDLDPSGCHCTKIEQDPSCPVGYPSLLCDDCGGTGFIPRVDLVVPYIGSFDDPPEDD